MNSDYKIPKYSFCVYPSKGYGNVPPSTYNATLASHWLLDYADVVIPFTNQSLYQVMETKLDNNTPNYHNLNHLIAETISAVTASCRFPDEQVDGNFNDILVNSIPYRRICFLTPSLAPLIGKNQQHSSSAISPKYMIN